MKFLKQISILIVSLIVLVLIIALFVEKEYDVNRSVNISKSNSEVFDYVKNLRNLDNYAVWQKKDPNVIQTYAGTDGEVGSKYTWASDHEEVGNGEQEVIAIDENKRVDFALRFKTPMEMEAQAYMLTKGHESGNSTDVTWGFKGESAYPWNFFMLFIDMDEQLGPDLQEGLDNLKVLMESND